MIALVTSALGCLLCGLRVPYCSAQLALMTCLACCGRGVLGLVPVLLRDSKLLRAHCWVGQQSH